MGKKLALRVRILLGKLKASRRGKEKGLIANRKRNGTLYALCSLLYALDAQLRPLRHIDMPQINITGFLNPEFVKWLNGLLVK